MPVRPAVFLDRDDTLVRCRDLPAPPPPAASGDLIDPARVELLPGVREACSALAGAGLTLVVVTNQGGVARGGTDLRGVERVNDRVRELVGRRPDGRWVLAGFYCCPFHPLAPAGRWAAEHPWRKPGPGMIAAASAELELDPARSWLVGDSERDVASGAAAGLAPARCLRIGAGGGPPDLRAAAEYIISHIDRQT